MKSYYSVVHVRLLSLVVPTGLALVLAYTGSASSPIDRKAFEAPPPAPPVQIRDAVEPYRPFQQSAETEATEYSIGKFGPKAQLYVELINRARADPLAEAQRLANTGNPKVLGAIDFFSSNLTIFKADMATLPARPPLAPNAKLTKASKIHSEFMLEETFQGHIGPNGTDGGDRATAQGYEWARWSENVFSFAKSVFHAHAGFEIDWGEGPTGLQDPPNHRLNIHSGDFREIGVGVVTGTKTIPGTDGKTVGPQLVTQLFAIRREEFPFITGVVYYDLDSDAFYDINEGIADVRVEVEGSSFEGITASSGGYAVPVPGDGTYTVQYSAPGLPSTSREVTVSNEENVKLDHLPEYTPPKLTGPERLRPDREAIFTFNPVGAAKAYQWESSRGIPVSRSKGFETKLKHFRIKKSLAYSIRQNDVAGKGNYALQLAHVKFNSNDRQWPIPKVVWKQRFRPGSNGELTFLSRLGVATDTQEARIEVSTRQSPKWETVWRQTGTEDQDNGEMDFTRRTVSLSDFAGQEIRIRFVYDVTESGFLGAQEGRGWYLDDLRLTDTRRLVGRTIHNAGLKTQFVFSPNEKQGNYQLRARAKVSNRWLPWGPVKGVAAHWQSKSTKITRVERLTGPEVMVHIKVLAGSLDGLELQKAPSPTGPWTEDPNAELSGTGDQTRFQFRTEVDSGTTFYRAIGK